jgi:hypothetical protein
MNDESRSINVPQKIGQYINCNSEIILHGLKIQKQLHAQGNQKHLGEILLEFKIITPKDLSIPLGRQRIGPLP